MLATVFHQRFLLLLLRTVTLAYLCIAATDSLAALDPKKAPEEYVFKTWTEEDGLPHWLVSLYRFDHRPELGDSGWSRSDDQ